MVRRRLLDDGKQSGNDVSPHILIAVLILAIAVIFSASLYLLLRFFRRNNNHNHGDNNPRSTTRHVISRRVTPAEKNPNRNPLIEALPLFTSESLKTSGDCAVCLSKFEQNDLLRLLPICCHVFHAGCIDTWLNSNQSCPLCRSPVFLPDSELLSKLTTDDDTSSSVSSGSFRVEIGNVSRRNSNSGEIPVRRTYSLGGNFDYIVDDDDVSEVHSGSFRRTSSTTEFKVDSDNNNNNNHQQGVLAAEVGARGGGGGWLKDYLTHSLSSSFRNSGRWFFTGSSRRETTTTTTDEFGVSEMDLEASRLGDEIGELFRWLSGV